VKRLQAHLKTAFLQGSPLFQSPGSEIDESEKMGVWGKKNLPTRILQVTDTGGKAPCGVGPPGRKDGKVMSGIRLSSCEASLLSLCGAFSAKSRGLDIPRPKM
jgi:hypothetical protein